MTTMKVPENSAVMETAMFMTFVSMPKSPAMTGAMLSGVWANSQKASTPKTMPNNTLSFPTNFGRSTAADGLTDIFILPYLFPIVHCQLTASSIFSFETLRFSDPKVFPVLLVLFFSLQTCCSLCTNLKSSPNKQQAYYVLWTFFPPRNSDGAASSVSRCWLQKTAQNR